MASNSDFRQPPNSVDAEDAPTWEHIEDVAKAPRPSTTRLPKDEPLRPLLPTIQISSNEESHDYEKPYSIFCRGMHASTANLSPEQWLTVAAENTHILPTQTRRLIEKVASLQKAIDALSEMSRLPRDHTSPGSLSPKSASLSAAAAADPALQNTVEKLERHLCRLCGHLSRQVEEEMRQGMLHLAERQRAADGEQRRRELAWRQLKQREAEGIQATRKRLSERTGLSLENDNGNNDDGGKGDNENLEERGHAPTSAQEQRELTFERATALTKAGWRKSL